MDQILLGLGAAGAALLIIAIAVAVWEHRRHIAEMRQQLAWSENTRDLLQAHAKNVDARLAALAAAVHTQQQAALAGQQAVEQVMEKPAAQAPPAPVATAAGNSMATAAQGAAQSGGQPRTTATAATAHAGAASAALAAAQLAPPAQWVETEPMVLTSQVFTPEANWPRMPDFDPTMPAEFSEH